MVETMIPPQVRMRLPTMREKKKKKKETIKRKKQREKGHASSTLVLQSSTMFFIWRVSYVVTFKYQREFFIIELDAHPLSFILSFHALISLSALVAWQSLLLALISIDGHLHSLLVSRIDVRVSYFFVFSMFTPIIILYSTRSAISMAYAHVLREDCKS